LLVGVWLPPSLGCWFEKSGCRVGNLSGGAACVYGEVAEGEGFGLGGVGRGVECFHGGRGVGGFGSEFGIHCLLEWTDILCRSLLAGRRERLTSRGREGNRFCNLRWGVVVVAFTFHLLLITELLTFATVKGIRRLRQSVDWLANRQTMALLDGEMGSAQ
jgi:hypothetical protein